MKVYLAHNGYLVVDSGSSVKSYAHDPSTPFKTEVVGTQVWLSRGQERIMHSENAVIFQSDGVTPAGATAALTATYIQNLLTVLES